MPSSLLPSTVKYPGYANQEISHLLATLESHLGVVVMLFESAQEAQRRHGRLQPRVVRFPPA